MPHARKAGRRTRDREADHSELQTAVTHHRADMPKVGRRQNARVSLFSSFQCSRCRFECGFRCSLFYVQCVPPPLAQSFTALLRAQRHGSCLQSPLHHQLHMLILSSALTTLCTAAASPIHAVLCHSPSLCALLMQFSLRLWHTASATSRCHLSAEFLLPVSVALLFSIAH